MANSSVGQQLAQWREQQQQAAANAPRPPPNAITDSAGFGIRLLARLVDLVLGFFLGLASGCLFGIVMGILQAMKVIEPDWPQRMQGISVVGFVLSATGYLLYHTATEGFYGASLGKLICKLRVISADRQPCGLRQAFLRSVAYLWDALFFGAIAYVRMDKSELNQRYGDAWAKTVVVKAGSLPAEAARPLGMLFLGLGAGITCWMLSAILGLLLKVM